MKFASAIFVAYSFLFVVAAAQDQTGTIKGTVVLNDGTPGAGASVTLLDTKYGIGTRNDGTFLLANVPVGTYKLSVRLIGYEQGESLSVRVKKNDTTIVNVELRQSDIELGQVLVTGTRRQAASDVRPSVTTMTPREAKYLPGAAEDVLRSLQALPGVTSMNDLSSQLIIRGSGPDQNLIMIDGFEVINPYRLYGVVSMFNPETVSDISLQTGGFTAQYGDRLSAVIDVKNREGRGDVPFAAKLNFSLTNMNLIFEGGLPIAGSSYLLSLRRTYYDLILGPLLKSAKLVQGDVALPNFRDLQFRAGMPLGESGRLILNAITSRDGASLISGAERDRADSISLFDASYNTMFGLTWQYNPSDKVIVNTQVSWYRNEGSGSFDGTFVDPSQNSGSIERGDTRVQFVNFAVDYGYKYDKTSLLQRWLWNASNHTVEAGFGADLLRTAFTRLFDIDQDLKNIIAQNNFIVPADEIASVSFQRYNVYVQDRIAFGDRLFVQPGIRLDYYPFIRTNFYVAPRLNISYKVSELSTLRAAYGLYFQSPGMEKQNFQGSLTFSDASFERLDAERAQHFILGFDRMMTPSWQLKTEVYYKKFDGLAAAEKMLGSRWYSTPTGDSIFTTRGWTTPVRIPSDSLTPFPVNGARGKAYGFEVMLQKIRSLPTDKITGWISYALSYAERERDGKITPFLFDQRHAMNIVGDYKFAEKWDLGLRFTLRSGRPTKKALGVRPRVILVTQNGVSTPYIQTDLRGKVLLDVDYERDTYSDKLDLYHSLDVRLTTYPGWWGLDWAIYLDVQNVLNHKNVQQQSYYINEQGKLQKRIINGIPIFPSLGMSIAF